MSFQICRIAFEGHTGMVSVMGEALGFSVLRCSLNVRKRDIMGDGRRQTDEGRVKRNNDYSESTNMRLEAEQSLKRKRGK